MRVKGGMQGIKYLILDDKGLRRNAEALKIRD